jgi:phosphoglycerate dehydrogenase-like enzyme
MKILIIGSKERYEKFSSEQLKKRGNNVIFCHRSSGDAELLNAAKDADLVICDAITIIGRNLIDNMPKLKMIHSEGVAYDKIDLDAASERGIYVCNNKGCNAGAVAEQAILLMLAFLRKAVVGDREVRAGRQIQMKERLMVEGITDLADCAVGLIGFGDIAKAAALRLKAFGSKVYYYKPRRESAETENAYAVEYASLEELAAKSDIVSIHSAVTNETKGMINGAFLNRMKNTAFIVNTARGEIVDNDALRRALLAGKIAGAAFDTLYPEPTPASHPLVDLPGEFRDRVIYSPHLGGITTGSFFRMHRNIWENVARLERGEKPDCVVSSR